MQAEWSCINASTIVDTTDVSNYEGICVKGLPAFVAEDV